MNSLPEWLDAKRMQMGIGTHRKFAKWLGVTQPLWLRAWHSHKSTLPLIHAAMRRFPDDAAIIGVLIRAEAQRPDSQPDCDGCAA